MSLKPTLLAVVLMVASAMLLFHLFQRQVSLSALPLGAPPEVLGQLQAGLEDQKRLADLDPADEAAYRQRFSELEATVHRLQILAHSRERIVRRYEMILLFALAACVVGPTSVYAFRQSRHAPRLSRLQEALTRLVGGETDIEIADRGRDTIGRIAGMIEGTSRVMARDRQRLAVLHNLSSWQQAARRHGHEMRTPLTAARLELGRLRELLAAEKLERRADVERGLEEVHHEIERLSVFARGFSSFARLPEPHLEPLDLVALMEEFVGTYESAWPGLELSLSPPGASSDLGVAADRDLVRQVLVNLCDNSAAALAERTGRVLFSLSGTSEAAIVDVADDGPGVKDSLRPRLFEPFVTSHRIGEGMGLGLAISKKILLDHGGDLELARSSSTGTTFRLLFPHRP